MTSIFQKVLACRPVNKQAALVVAQGPEELLPLVATPEEVVSGRARVVRQELHNKLGKGKTFKGFTVSVKKLGDEFLATIRHNGCYIERQPEGADTPSNARGRAITIIAEIIKDNDDAQISQSSGKVRSAMSVRGRG